MNMNADQSSPCLLGSFLLQQTESIEVDFKEMTSCIIAASKSNLINLSNVNSWKIFTLPKISHNSALVVCKDHSGPELWVNAFYTGYRKVFQIFLNQFYSKYNLIIPKSFHVDHLHPVVRFNKKKHKDYFIRLALVYKKTNLSYGGGFEKLLYVRERNKTLNSNIFMDWFVFLKINHIDVIKKDRGVDEWKIWCWKLSKLFAKRGFDPIITYIELGIVLNLSYQDEYKPLYPHKFFLNEMEKYPNFYYLSNLVNDCLSSAN